MPVLIEAADSNKQVTIHWGKRQDYWIEWVKNQENKVAVKL